MAIYLDNASTTKPYNAALYRFQEVNQHYWFNPSSRLYSTEASKLVMDSRQKIANALGCEPKNIIFTSGSTEAANLVINQDHWDNIIFSKIEHPCVYNPIMLSECAIYSLMHDSNGLVDLKELQNYIDILRGRNLVVIMGANNEIGTIQDLFAIADIVHSRPDNYFFCDTTQLWPYEPINISGIDFACMSAHKFGGLKGTGFLYAADPSILEPLFHGGPQEYGLRPGTENVGGIVAMAEALQITERYKAEFKENAIKIRKHILSHDEYKFNCADNAVQNIVSLTMPDCDGQRMVAALGLDGIYISAGSACSTGESKPSRVLKAIGLSDDEARRTIRISFSGKTRECEINTLFNKMAEYREVLHE